MSPSIVETIGDASFPRPEVGYSRRVASGVAVLDAVIRDRGKLLMQSRLARYEHERLRRLQNEDKACRSVVCRHLERGELFHALETLLANNIRC